MQRPRYKAGVCAAPEAASFSSHSELTLKTDVTAAAAAAHAIWRHRALGTRRGSRPREAPGPLAPRSLPTLLSFPSSESLPAAAPTLSSLLSPPPTSRRAPLSLHQL